ncbi:hypothetical protein [Antarcticimicrobium luteum]|uniref:hypothetical protein n=1 Tax=Antarcticimicrobium luteum TaxID=2547397 RepID=UPI001FDF5469|nr:hypothetical protein [Antarcticimicrobium luteum]
MDAAEDRFSSLLQPIIELPDQSFCDVAETIILDPSSPGCPVHQIKVADQFKGLLDPRRPMGVETGRAMAEWAKGQGNAQKQKEILDRARAEARNRARRHALCGRGETALRDLGRARL